MKKKIKIRKTLKAWKNLPLEVSFLQVIEWVNLDLQTKQY